MSAASGSLASGTSEALGGLPDDIGALATGSQVTPGSVEYERIASAISEVRNDEVAGDLGQSLSHGDFYTYKTLCGSRDAFVPLGSENIFVSRLGLGASSLSLAKTLGHEYFHLLEGQLLAWDPVPHKYAEFFGLSVTQLRGAYLGPARPFFWGILAGRYDTSELMGFAEQVYGSQLSH